MSQLGEAAVAVKMRDPVTDRQLVLQLADRPPRSRLYGIVPREGGTLWAECLTSYLNRLSWRHGLSPRSLVAHELVPLLSADDLPRSNGD